MKRAAIVLAAAVGLLGACLLAHMALIEWSGEVIVLRTEKPGGGWLETRLWIVDDGGSAWLHGGDSAWMANLRARPVVEIERSGATRRYRAEAVPGPHPRIHELLRGKYGFADRWVRFVGPDQESTTAVRLEFVAAP
ncbi:MAG TPA: hypothetical protein VII72_11635 [Myxococcota bacterium]|jgi:hypothetical protein